MALDPLARHPSRRHPRGTRALEPLAGPRRLRGTRLGLRAPRARHRGSMLAAESGRQRIRQGHADGPQPAPPLGQAPPGLPGPSTGGPPSRLLPLGKPSRLIPDPHRLRLAALLDPRGAPILSDGRCLCWRPEGGAAPLPAAHCQPFVRSTGLSKPRPEAQAWRRAARRGKCRRSHRVTAVHQSVHARTVSSAPSAARVLLRRQCPGALLHKVGGTMRTYHLQL